MLSTSLEYHVLVTLPLLAVSISVPVLWPLFLASLLFSFGVCIAAAAQVPLPKKNRRYWSRPLVALLFFLQPIARGWARYQWRLTVRPQPRGGVRRAPPVARLAPIEELEKLYYWSETGFARLSFLQKAVERLDKDGWEIKLDTGWNDHDAEVYGQRWARLRLTTVAEYFPGGKTMIRCRLLANWSLRARLFFWTLLGAELALVGVLRDTQPWLWMILLSVPLLGWFFEQEKRNLQALISIVLDRVATDTGMAKVKSCTPATPTSVAPGAS
jgi:hypothetical protein